MAKAHFAFTFRYIEYQNDMSQYVKQVDQQNYEPLRSHVLEALRKFRLEWPIYTGGWSKPVQGWPLLDFDGGLPTENMIKDKGIPASRDLGDWFLIILAEYLQPCPSPRGNWSVLNTALEMLGWKVSLCRLLFKGLATSKLLKPSISQKSPWPLKDSDPYWLWLHPGRARSSWLSIAEIRELYDKLVDKEQGIREYDVRRIPNINIDNPVVVKDYEAYLQAGYADTLAMLTTALELNQGLFMGLTLQ
jgi:hypothetical protein